MVSKAGRLTNEGPVKVFLFPFFFNLNVAFVFYTCEIVPAAHIRSLSSSNMLHEFISLH